MGFLRYALVTRMCQILRRLARLTVTPVDQVVSTAGDCFLGGSDFTHLIADWAADQCLQLTGSDPRYFSQEDLPMK